MVPGQKGNACMKIVIDCRMWNESGVGRYIRNLVVNLQVLDSKNEYFLILLKKDILGLELKKNFHKVVGDFKWYGVTEQIRLPRILRLINADLVHFPHFNVPIFYWGKFVVTIHDLIHQHFQMRRSTTHDPLTYKIKHFGYTTVFKNAIRKSKEILVPSNYVKDLLINEWDVEGKKVVVTPEAVDHKLYTIVNSLSQNKAKRILEKFGVMSAYVFYLGNAHPHKNVEGLIRVFLILKKNYKELQLVLSGSDHYFWQKIKNKYQNKGIIYTGYVTDQELVTIYKNAKCFVMPSFEEGFGIPILEAMALGCPVVSSNTASLPEVGGDAVLYFNPKDQGDMVEKINMVLKSEKLRKDLIEKGMERVGLFSWEELAKETLEVYKQCE